jgi:hypothetical protein
MEDVDRTAPGREASDDRLKSPQLLRDQASDPEPNSLQDEPNGQHAEDFSEEIPCQPGGEGGRSAGQRREAVGTSHPRVSPAATRALVEMRSMGLGDRFPARPSSDERRYPIHQEGQQRPEESQAARARR